MTYEYPEPPAWFADSYTKDPANRVQFAKSKKLRDGSIEQEVFWQSEPGPQTWMLHCPYDEIVVGGQRGGGKSQGLIAKMVMGDKWLPPDDPARLSFVLDPSYRGLLLRQEYQSMAEFVDEAMDLYRHFDCKAKDDPVVFHFKSGAKIYTNHLGSPEAYTKYKGWNITRIGIEELTQIPEFRWYVKLLGSLRSKGGHRIFHGKQFPKLRTQITSTTNPDGPGHTWVKERVVEVYAGGKIVPPNTPMFDPITKLTRIYIPMPLSANSYLRDDEKYRGMLLSQDAKTRAQWMEADWDAGEGTFFTEYRPDGPVGQEEKDKYPWACHVVREPYPELPSWWFRWGSGDWGYDHPSCFHKFCRNERDKRIHVYDELSLRRVSAYETGVTVANWWLPELEKLPDHQITLYFSPDAFSKTDDVKTRAEQFASGVQEILGPYGALLLRYTSEERDAAAKDPQLAARMFQHRTQATEGKMRIIVKPASTDRVGGWNYMHELMRFRPVRTETEEEIKQRLATIFQRSGVEAYERELAQYRKLGQEILPRLQLWHVCRGLDRFLKSAQHDEDKRREDVKKFDAEDGKGGDDPGDSARYGLQAYKEIEVSMPKSYWVAEKATEVLAGHEQAFGEPLTDPTRLAMVAMRQSALYEKQAPHTGGTITFARQGSQRHRVH